MSQATGLNLRKNPLFLLNSPMPVWRLTLDVVLALQGPAVYLAMPGMIPHVPDTNTSSLKQMLEVFVESGGRLLVCITCMEERNLKATDLIEQAVPTSGSALTEEILSAKATLTS